ncbi:MAG: serine/threonine protein kinase [Victivallales bacterium]|nr:serine/threonine protein kinase [Victivallales bacterium]
MEKFFSKTDYRVVKKIAEGGMGAVYKAQQKGIAGFEKTVAIKTLLGHFAKNRQFIDRFVFEAKLVANLVHENIVQIYQLDRHKGEYFFILEFVNGVSLFSFVDFLVRTKTLMPEKLAVFIASRIARGLAYAHSRCDTDGKPLFIVHCDVCPHNIMITTEGLPKLTDFGIARATSTGDEKSVSGKLPFMSPEQINRENVDFRSDIYSLGMVLFYMLSGKNARRIDISNNDTIEQAKKNTIHWEFMPDDIDEELLKIITKMLETDPEKRYQDTSELSHALEYHIYKDGYGPTIVTLSEYMRKQMPILFDTSSGYTDDKEDNTDISGKTILMNPDSSNIDKTIKLPEEFFDEK